MNEQLRTSHFILVISYDIITNLTFRCWLVSIVHVHKEDNYSKISIVREYATLVFCATGQEW